MYSKEQAQAVGAAAVSAVMVGKDGIQVDQDMIVLMQLGTAVMSAADEFQEAKVPAILDMGAGAAFDLAQRRLDTDLPFDAGKSVV